MEPPTEFSPAPSPWDASSSRHYSPQRQRQQTYSRQQQQQQQQQLHQQQQQQPQQPEYGGEQERGSWQHQSDQRQHNVSPQRQQQRHQQQEQHEQLPERVQSTSRGRSATSRYQTPVSISNANSGSGSMLRTSPSTHSSHTPRRKGNPQSSSPSLEDSRQQYQQTHQQQQQVSSSISPGANSTANNNAATTTPSSSSQQPPLNPLSTLTAILTSHSSHTTTSIQLYRQSHTLHRNAADRTKKALERLREAQAEVEHATTAEEYAKEELERAALQKGEANNAMSAMGKRVRAFSKCLVDKRVRLVGLEKNVQWNGRLGVIVKLVTEGEDVGRWKVKLDRVWRGRDADGRRIVNNDDDEQDDEDGEGGGSANVVVAKAENLELVMDDNGYDDEAGEKGMGPLLFGGNPSSSNRQLSQSRSRSASRSTSSQRREPQHSHQEIHATKSRDPEQEQYYDNSHHNHRQARDPSISSRTRTIASVAQQPVAVTPEGRGSNNASNNNNKGSPYNITPVSYYKSEKDGQYHESPPRQQGTRSGQQQHHSSIQQQQQQQPQPHRTRQLSPSISPRHASPSKKHPRQQQQQQNIIRQTQSSPKRPSPFKLNPPRGAPPRTRSSSSHNNNNSNSKYDYTQIIRSPSNDSSRLSSAFERMLLSPVSFTPVSFNPSPNDEFQQWMSPVDENQTSATRHHSNDGVRGQQGQQQQQQQHSNQFKPYASSPGDVVSVAGSFFDEVTSLDRNMTSFPPYSVDENNANANANADGFYDPRHGETSSDPQLEQYPSQEEINAEGHALPNIVVLPVDEDDSENIFLSPGYSSSSPANCVGVQNAGMSHVNGVYLLAYPKDENGDAAAGAEGTPPLYFRDGPPILLSDNRYYDMCILRINCPDSPDHVIWFLARVDVDPECLDVKFSDCFYYCRMLRNDDGCGGEREGGCQSPPSRGWNVPKLPPGVEMLRIAPSGSFSMEMESTVESTNPGQHGLGISSRPNAKEQAEMADFDTPGVDSGVFSGMSKYSI